MKERAKIKKKTIINLEMSRNVTSEPKMYFAYFDRKVTTWGNVCLFISLEKRPEIQRGGLFFFTEVDRYLEAMPRTKSALKKGSWVGLISG